MCLFRVLSCAAAAMVLTGFVVAETPAHAQSEATHSQRVVAPWGVSSSASAWKSRTEWMPKMAEAGVTTVRLFPEWRSFEPTKGTWKWDDGDALLKAAASHRIEVNAILMGSPPGNKAVHAFPMDNLDDWSNHVSKVVGRYGDQVRYWEVWNEGNGGFNDGHHGTSDYAKLAIETYSAAKKADSRAKIGLTVASFDAPYLNQTILAMERAGKPNHFDYLCIHPYEIADGLANPDGEIPFLWMTKALRGMLKTSAPDRANAEIWISEVGRRIESLQGRSVTERDAASGLIKIYAMSLAQGISRVQWFEAQDPVDEDQGFGLLHRDGRERASYKALKTLIAHLGPTPTYQGWLALGRDGRGYGFVFAGKSGSVLIAWMPADQTKAALPFSNDVRITDSLGATTTVLNAQQAFELTEAPVLVEGIPENVVKQALANSALNFPWGGDYSNAKTVSHLPGTAQSSNGVFQVGPMGCPRVCFADGSSGILAQGDINHPVTFYVHPSFATFQTKEYYIRATVRRVADGNVGMNLLYEVADSQGSDPYVNSGKWFGASKEADWQTYTWHVTNACFSKMWGYDFILRPEQSIPFVLGKVEVSIEPFK